MIGTRWFSDEYAKSQYAKIKEHLTPLVCKFLGPGYELSHLGINRNEDSGEVVLKLHLNPIGAIKCSGDYKLLRGDKP